MTKQEELIAEVIIHRKIKAPPWPHIIPFTLFEVVTNHYEMLGLPSHLSKSYAHYYLSVLLDEVMESLQKEEKANV